MPTVPPPTVHPVDAYVQAQPPGTQGHLALLRATLAEVMPNAEQVISYQIPCFRLDGTYAVYCAGYAHHVGLYPITQAMRDAVGEALSPYLSGKATARFALDVPLPVELIRQLVTARVAEIEAIMATRPSKRPLKSRRPMIR
ncbi:DUF1801 domain-containing protein [Myxococcota bacterium]|nr:DUF1801 domain-containing protein [Myxococcota bacterium]